MTEMDRLEAFLKEGGYDYERRPLFDTGAEETDCEQIIVMDADGERIWDAVEDRSPLAGMAGVLEGTGSVFKEHGEQITAHALIWRLKNGPLKEYVEAEKDHTQMCRYAVYPQASEMRCL